MRSLSGVKSAPESEREKMVIVAAPFLSKKS